MVEFNDIQQYRLDEANNLKNKFLQLYPKLSGIKTFEVEKLGEDVFSATLDGKNIVAFYNKNGDMYFNVSEVRKDYYFQAGLELGGFSEVKNETTGEFEMFNGSKIDSSKKISTSSIEYYNAWVDIAFYTDIMGVRTMISENKGGGYTDVPERFLNIVMNSGALRIKHVLVIYKHGQISKELAEKTIRNLQSKLLQQIGDSRFSKLGNPVTIEEIETYRQNKLISNELYINAIGLIGNLEIVEGGRVNERKTATEGLKDDLRKILEGIEIK